MNLINRVIVIVELLILVALMPILIVVLLFFLPTLPSTVESYLRNLASPANLVLTQIICVGVTALIFATALLLLFIELQHPTGRRLRVQVPEGQVEVTEDAIIQRLEHNILQVADVVHVKPRATSTRKGDAVNVFLELETNPDVNVPQKTQEVIGAARRVIEEQMGLKLGKVHAQIGYARVSKKPPAAPPPLPAPPQPGL